MAINIITRHPEVIIDGLNVSAGLTALTWGDSDYQSQTGVIKTEGSLTLSGAGLNWTEDLDDRANARWARGKPITIRIANEANALTTPRCGGRLHILKSQWDGQNTLTLSLGCRLALMDAATPPGEGIEGFGIGQTQTDGPILSRLGSKLGATISGGLGGYSINVPLSKLNQDSPVKQLGALCWANGRIAYVDGRDGVIKIIPVNLTPSPLLTRWVEHHAVEYNRQTGAESPCEKVIVTGAKVVAAEPESDRTEGLEETFGSGWVVRAGGTEAQILLNRTTEWEELDRGSRKRVKFRQVEQPSGLFIDDLPMPEDFQPAREQEDREAAWENIQRVRAFRLLISEQITTSSRFERRIGAGSKIDEARLLTVETIANRQAEDIYAAYNSNRISDPSDPGFNGSPITLTGLIEGDRTTVQYIYRKIRKSTSSTMGGGGSGMATVRVDFAPIIEIITTVEKIRAEVFPQARIGNPYAWQWVSRERRWWARDEQNPDGYKLVIESETPQLLEFRGDIAEIWQIDAAAQIAKRTERTERGPQIQPPTPERYPADASTTEEPVVGVAKLPGLDVPAVRDREREFRADAGMISSAAKAQRVASIEGAILWGRYKGANWITAVPDAMLSAPPLRAWDWVEFPTGRIQRYLVDGQSFAYGARRTVFSADGIWVGTVGVVAGADWPTNPPHLPSVVPVPNPPAPDPEDETEAPPPVRPYQVIQSFAVGMGMQCGFRHYPYALDLPMQAFAVGMGMNLPDLYVSEAPAVRVQQSGGEWRVAEGVAGAATVNVKQDGNADPQPSGAATVRVQQSGGEWRVVTGEGGSPILNVRQDGNIEQSPSGEPTINTIAEGAEDA